MLDIPKLFSVAWRTARFAILGAVVLLGLSILTEWLTEPPDLEDVESSWRFLSSVLVNLIPAIIVSFFVFWLAGRFVKALYKLDSTRQGISFLWSSRFGQWGFAPWMRLEKGMITKNEDSIVAHLGGPGHLVVYNDSAVILEHQGKLSRVVGSGFTKLKPFERIYDIVDLRPKRYVHTVEAMTKEGIAVTWDAEVQYQIGDPGQQPTKESPYPFSQRAVFQAATSRWVFIGRATDLDWEALIVRAEMEVALRSILARLRLDQLIGQSREAGQSMRKRIRQELEDELRQIAPDLGAKILSVELDNLEVEDDKITQQWIRIWQSHWERWSRERLAQGEAARIYLLEQAKAESQMSLIVKITRAFQSLTPNERLAPRIVLMRLFSVLDRASFAPASRVFFPNEAFDALDSMKQLLGDGQPPEGQA